MIFSDGQRIRIIDTDHPCYGMTGTVIRLLIRHGGEAWVTCDTDIPETARRFFDKRKNNVCLFPEQAEEIPPSE